MRESTVEDYLTKRVKAEGGEVRKVKWIGRSHAPDRLALVPAAHPLIELKRPGKKPTAAQLREHVRLRRAGFEVWVIDTKEGVDTFIRSYFP